MNASGVNGLHPGLFFHSVNARGTVEWQGFIKSRRDDGRLELQLFRWADGRPNGRAYVAEAEMADWRFFPSNAAMRESGNRLIATNQQSARKRARLHHWLMKTGQMPRMRTGDGPELPGIISGQNLMETQKPDANAGCNA